MSRQPSVAFSSASLFSMIAGAACLAGVAACGATSDTAPATTASTAEQALTEAQGSFSAASAAADACFATFDSCKSADGGEQAACDTALHACLPAKPGRGPHCGVGGAPPVESGCDRDHDGPPPAGDPGKNDGPHDRDGGPRPPRDHDDQHAGGLPDFCKEVPLPASAELAACHATLDACAAAGTDRKTCHDADRACVKAAWANAFAKACADTGAKSERLTELCAAGITGP